MVPPRSPVGTDNCTGLRDDTASSPIAFGTSQSVGFEHIAVPVRPNPHQLTVRCMR